MATPTLQNYIDGRWVDATDRGTFENINPATGELIANVAKSTVADVDRAVDAARRALDGWRLYPAPKRGEILFRAGEIMLTRKDDLAREMTREMGKVIAEARGDVQEGIDMTYYIAGEGRRQFGDVVPAELPNKWAMSTRHPVGVVAAITPWNFPFAIPTWKIMPALILGNTIVFKPASYTPLLAVRLVEILEEAGLPKGVINLVLGSGGELGDHIVSHPGVDLISFTGSSDTGNRIRSHPNVLARGVLVNVEADSINAALLAPDAGTPAFDAFVKEVVREMTEKAGQKCTAIRRVFVPAARADAVTEALAARLAKVVVGDPRREDVRMGPVVTRAQQAAALKGISRLAEEASFICGGPQAPALDGRSRAISELSPSRHASMSRSWT